MSELSSCVIASWLECFPEKPSWCQNEQVCQGVKYKVLLEWSKRLYAVLYIKIYICCCRCQCSEVCTTRPWGRSNGPKEAA